METQSKWMIWGYPHVWIPSNTGSLTGSPSLDYCARSNLYFASPKAQTADANYRFGCVVGSQITHTHLATYALVKSLLNRRFVVARHPEAQTTDWTGQMPSDN